jgi:hypothetical protein
VSSKNWRRKCKFFPWGIGGSSVPWVHHVRWLLAVEGDVFALWSGCLNYVHRNNQKSLPQILRSYLLFFAENEPQALLFTLLLSAKPVGSQRLRDMDGCGTERPESLNSKSSRGGWWQLRGAGYNHPELVLKQKRQFSTFQRLIDT